MFSGILGTAAQPDSDIIGTLSSLLQANSGVIAAYDSAIDRLDDNIISYQFREFADDYRSYESRVTSCILNLGGDLVSGSELNHFILACKVMIADLLGDKAIMRAMASIERRTKDVHQRAIDEASALGLTEVETMLREILTDEQSHVNWIEESVKSLN